MTSQRDLTLAALRKQPKGGWIARFKEITDRNGAEALHGCSVMIKEAERAPLPEGEYYVDQLLGLDVVTDTGRSLGKLTDVLNTPAHDVYVTDDGAHDSRLPEISSSAWIWRAERSLSETCRGCGTSRERRED